MIMKREDLRDIQILCLNSIQGKDSWLYHEIPKERIKEIYKSLLDQEYQRDMKVLERLKTLSEDEKKDIMKIIRINLSQEVKDD